MMPCFRVEDQIFNVCVLGRSYTCVVVSFLGNCACDAML